MRRATVRQHRTPSAAFVRTVAAARLRRGWRSRGGAGGVCGRRAAAGSRARREPVADESGQARPSDQRRRKARELIAAGEAQVLDLRSDEEW